MKLVKLNLASATNLFNKLLLFVLFDCKLNWRRSCALKLTDNLIFDFS